MKIVVPASFCFEVSLFLCMVLISHEARELPPTIEIKLYVSSEFQSEVCLSPDLSSPAPYWEFNSTLLNDKEINTYYGAIVGRNTSREGHHQSNLTIPSVDLGLNATVISCLVSGTVIQQYHVIVVEAELAYLPTEEFHSGLCVSPSATSPAPYFKYNNILLNDDTVNEFYQATVSRNYSVDGHHQAWVVITGLGSTLNNSNVTCLVDSAVIWKAHLLTGSRGNPSTTAAAVESTATSDGVTLPELPQSRSAGSSEVSVWILILLPVVMFGLPIIVYEELE